jgi:hypothetical protein
MNTTRTLEIRWYSHSHFPDVGTKAENGELIFLRSDIYQVIEKRFKSYGNLNSSTKYDFLS